MGSGGVVVWWGGYVGGGGVGCLVGWVGLCGGEVKWLVVWVVVGCVVTWVGDGGIGVGVGCCGVWG